MKGEEPQGTLECPEGFVLDDVLKLCVPENPISQAQVLKITDKMERCILSVKQNLVKKNPKMGSKVIKSTAIAICRSRLKQ